MRAFPAVVLYAAALLTLACSGDGEPAPTAALITPTPAAATSTLDRVVTIAAVGDIMLARDLVTLMHQHGALYPYERVAHLLRDADLTVANLETTFTERGVAADKLYTFRTPPRFAAGLAGAGIDVVSLGNNHTADFGPAGIEDTLAALDDVGIRYAGAGADEAAARQPTFVDVRGLRIAFLSYTDVLENTFAGPDRPGVAFAAEEAVAADVASARARADVVVALFHFGVEYTDAPQPDQQRLARAAIDAGALLVLGHHPHTLQGWERYRGGLIAYSLGNFVFDLDDEDLANLGPRAFQSAVLFVTLSDDEVLDVRAEPVVIDELENRPRPADPAEAAEIHERIDALNDIAGGP